MTANIDYAALGSSDLPAWAAALGELLIDARNALRASNHVAMDQASDALLEFMSRNAFESLDKLAFESIDDLAGKGLEEALSSIGARTVRLRALTGDLGKVSAKASKAAASIRMETVVSVLGAAEETIKSIRALKDTVRDDPNLKDVIPALDDLRTKAGKLREELKRAAQGE